MCSVLWCRNTQPALRTPRPETLPCLRPAGHEHPDFSAVPNASSAPTPGPRASVHKLAWWCTMGTICLGPIGRLACQMPAVVVHSLPQAHLLSPGLALWEWLPNCSAWDPWPACS